MANRFVISDSKAAARGRLACAPGSLENSRTDKNKRLRLWLVLAYILVAYAMFDGWLNRGSSTFVAEILSNDFFGVLSAVSILALLFHPLWKIFGDGRWQGVTSWWLKGHVVFGLLVPLSTLYHINFQVSSNDAQFLVGLVLAVTVSGLLGNMLHSQIKIPVAKLAQDKAFAKFKLTQLCGYASRFRNDLQAYEIAALSSSSNFSGALLRLMSFGIWTAWHEAKYRAELNEVVEFEAHRMGWTSSQARTVRAEAHKYLSLRLASIRKMSSQSFYRTLFSVWYALHLPLIVIATFAAVFHFLGL